jgi:hypothetical protein
MFANPSKQYLVGVLRVVVDRLTFGLAIATSDCRAKLQSPGYPRHFAQELRLSPLIGLEALGNA